MKEMDDRITQRTAEEQQRLAELEEEEEQRRNRREVYYGKDANARSQRSRRRHIYLFNPEDMDNADIISMVENSPTYLRDKSTLNSIKMRAEQGRAARHRSRARGRRRCRGSHHLLIFPFPICKTILLLRGNRSKPITIWIYLKKSAKTLKQP